MEKKNGTLAGSRMVVASLFLVAFFLILAGLAELVVKPKAGKPEPVFSLSEIARFDVASYEFTFEIITAARQVEKNISLLILTGGLLGRDEKQVLLRFRIQVKYGTSLLEEEGAEYTINTDRIAVRLPRLRIIGQPAIEAEIVDANNCTTEEMNRIRDGAREEIAKSMETLIHKFNLNQTARQWTSRAVGLILSLPFPGRRIEVAFKEEA